MKYCSKSNPSFVHLRTMPVSNERWLRKTQKKINYKPPYYNVLRHVLPTMVRNSLSLIKIRNNSLHFNI